MKPSEVFRKIKFTDDMAPFSKLYYKDCVVKYLRLDGISYIIIKTGDFKYAAYSKQIRQTTHHSEPTHTVIHQKNIMAVSKKIDKPYETVNVELWYVKRRYTDSELIKEFKEYLLLESI